jgi:hypothetical protein
LKVLVHPHPRRFHRTIRCIGTTRYWPTLCADLS